MYTDGRNGRSAVGVLMSYFGGMGEMIMMRQAEYLLH